MTSDKIRLFAPADAAPASRLIFDAVHAGAAAAYTEAQRAAWAPAPHPASALAARLEPQFALVAEDERGLSGLFALTHEGLLDLAFVRPDRMGDGLAGRLHDAILTQAIDFGLSALRVEASHLARRFLERRGWRLEATQSVQQNGVALENHRMTLPL